MEAKARRKKRGGRRSARRDSTHQWRTLQVVASTSQTGEGRKKGGRREGGDRKQRMTAPESLQREVPHTHGEGGSVSWALGSAHWLSSVVSQTAFHCPQSSVGTLSGLPCFPFPSKPRTTGRPNQTDGHFKLEGEGGEWTDRAQGTGRYQRRRRSPLMEVLSITPAGMRRIALTLTALFDCCPALCRLLPPLPSLAPPLPWPPPLSHPRPPLPHPPLPCRISSSPVRRVQGRPVCAVESVK